MNKQISALQFGQALVKHLGLDKHQVCDDLTLHTKGNEVFGVTLTITLDGADIEEIGRIMQGLDKPVDIKPAAEVWLYGHKLDRVVAFGEDAQGKWVEQELGSITACEIDTTTLYSPYLEFRPVQVEPAPKPDFCPDKARRAHAAVIADLAQGERK